MLITIFTPAYNRGNLLKRLYKSLCIQELQNFEWVIVDDGSVDDTEVIVEEFKQENKIPIYYHKQQNSGKHIAINKGAEMANGKLFFIVDSDDYLTRTATKTIEEKYKLIADNDEYAGISGRKGYSETEYIGSKMSYEDIHANALDFRYHYAVQGDMAEVIRTDIIRQYPFPVIENEKFCTEGILWYRVALKYRFLWFKDIIYVAEYLEGGLSNSIVRIRKQSPNYSILFYSSLAKMPIPFKEKVKASINFWRFAKHSNKKFTEKLKMTNILLSVITLPLGYLFAIKDNE